MSNGPDPATTEWVPVWNSKSTGPSGPQGPQGDLGPTGPLGPKGDTGAVGPTGSQGPQGLQGVLGPTGPKGDVGVAGPTGPVGPAGPLGPQGPVGPAGAGTTDLDYVGAYQPPVTYNKGDIVVAADGIAYMCVIDGTITAPEPWPGVGIATSVGPQGPQGVKGDKGDTGATGATGATGPQGATGAAGPQGPTGSQGAAGVNAAVDATYWTASTHPTLTNERSLGALANGYVKSTGGEPSTLAVIPLADGGTGATSAASARTSLGLGDMATQNSTAISITGGTVGGSTLIQTNNWIYGYAFAGDGSNLSNLNASLIAYGTVPVARLPPEAIHWSGMIVLSFSPCPAGWTRVTGYDTRYLRVSASPGSVGGAAYHNHGPGSLASQNHQHGPGSYAAVNHNHGGGGSGSFDVNTDTQGSHSHSYSGNIPVSGTTGQGSHGSPTASGGAYTGSVIDHSHDFSVNPAYSGNTSLGGSHAHRVQGSVSIGINNEAPAVGGVSDLAGALGIVGTSDLNNANPLFVDFYLCQKN
jgi:hypothetical protein